MAGEKVFLRILQKFGIYIALSIGLAMFLIVKEFSFLDILRITLLIIASLCLSWAFFFTLEIGFLKTFRSQTNEQIQSLQHIVAAFTKRNEARGIVPQFNEKIVPDMQTASDKLAGILRVKHLIDRFVLFQGGDDYKRALLQAARGPDIQEIKFIGTLYTAPH